MNIFKYSCIFALSNRIKKMTELEYKNKIQVIEDQYEQAKKQLYIDYANYQRKYNIGDIIKNVTGTIIKVQKYGVSVLYSLPRPTYIGIELRKDLVPKKNGSIGTIYGNADVELLKCADIK